MDNTFRILNARILDPATGRDAVADLLVVEGRIADSNAVPPADIPTLDARGCILTLGLWDLHAHFREPGDEGSETLSSGASAALRGGFSHVVTMPNTRPPVDSPAGVRRQARGAKAPRILPSACLTRARNGLAAADLPALAEAGAVAFTDDGSTVADNGVMLAAMRAAAAVGKPVMDHAVDPELAGKGVIRDCGLARRIELPLFPPEAEITAVERDLRLARKAGCRLHIQHLSTQGAVDRLRRARTEGLPASGEVTPHHLALSTDQIRRDDAGFKMNPPLGDPHDIAALIEGLRDGTLTALATDHAPHPADRKALGFRHAPFGIIGLETAAAVTYAVLVEEAGFSPLAWARLWTLGPADILGLRPPSLAAGQMADLALFDLNRPWKVAQADLGSKSANCPFLGWTLPLRPRLTVCDGAIVWRKAL